ncbi:MAG: DUF362 domain-containing protein [Deltaproteobacteria bacterium]|nr:DUF362 domain-containing protein [Deltaproteobacteria bacterium]
MPETPKVYHLSPHSKAFSYQAGLMGKLEAFLKEFDLARYLPRNAVVPLKMHLGNRGAFRTIRPQFVRMAVDAVRRVPAIPFVTDSARLPACEYLNVAMEAGYTHQTLGAPVIIADGVFGRDSIKVPAGEILGEVAVASAIHDAKAMVVLTHVKGHVQAVLGGALKNISMGGVSAAPRDGDWTQGRGRMHFLMGDVMEWDQAKCVLCNDCVGVCPAACITFPNDVYTIDDKRCFRCGRCARVCPAEAIDVPVSHGQFMRAIVEGAAAVLSTFEPKRVVYVSFLLEMQPECDCMPLADPPIAQDQGILISDDPVAVDAATLDVLSKTKPLPESRAATVELKEGWDLYSLLHKKDGRLLLREAEAKGLGTSEYELVEVG